MKFKTIVLILLLSCLLYSNGNINNFELGSAVYRELGNINGVPGQWESNHWHAGMFDYFEYINNKGYICYTEMIKPNTKNKSVYSTISTTNYSSDLLSLKNSFKNDFREGGDYYGTYSRTISPNTRNSIVSTARSLSEIDKYCWSDMLDPENHWQYFPPGWYESWNGNIGDIDELRCDCIVEYSHEKNGVHISNSNNISSSGNSHVDAHNVVHLDGSSYSSGELCPRIQAGEGHGGGGYSASELSALVSNNPILDTYSTSTPSTDVTQINLKIKDKESVKAYVLLLVAKSGSNNWHILKDNNGLTWKFKKQDLTDYSQGYQYDQFYIQWSGAYAGGGYFFTDGNYKLKVVIIDQGANYCEQIINFTADVDESNALSLNISNSGTTYSATATGGSNNYTDYKWWYRNDGQITRELPVGVWYHNSSWDDLSSITYSPSYNWSLKCQVTDSDGNTAIDTYSGLANNKSKKYDIKQISVPSEVVLSDNYPNPFNPITQIKYGLPKRQKVRLDVYSIDGKIVKTLVDGSISAGYHIANWDATNTEGAKVSSGVYIYQLRCSNKLFTKKMIFAK